MNFAKFVNRGTEVGNSAGDAVQRRLEIYLNDHFAGASAGMRLARRVADAQRNGPFGRELDAIAVQVAEDRAALLEIMRKVSVEPRAVYAWTGRAAELAGRLKPNGRLVRRAQLSSLVELEALRLGVLGKLQGWATLAIAAESDPRLDGERLRELECRAKNQADTLEGMRLTASGMLGHKAA